MSSPVRIKAAPGVKRDGTRLEGEGHVDAQWCRWHRGLPRKMRGFKSISLTTLSEKVYGMHAFVEGNVNYVHTGGATELWRQSLDRTGLLLVTANRTPAGLVNSGDNNWQFDVMYDDVSSLNRIIAHAAPNIYDISDSNARAVWYGTLSSTAVLTDTGAPQVSGGIVVVHPYLVAFGDAGEVNWSDAMDPTTWGAGSFARVTGSKIIRGMQLRGNGSGPAALLWSLDSLIRMQFNNDPTTVWAFDTISDDISVLSSNGIVEYDGIYYWAAVDRFMMFNGVVRELPNQMNLDWFFDDLSGGVNYEYRQKVFAFKVPRWGEIWWCYPRGSATECTHAVIYNVRENTWYDTQLPDSGRSAASFAKVFEHPMMTGVDALAGKYRLIKHEDGTDNIDGSDVNPIQSYFETGEITTLENQQATGNTLAVFRIEPDFNQSGDMTVTVRGRPNTRADPVDGTSVTFPDTATTPEEQTVKVKDAFRLMSFRFESNTQGGDYVMGQVYGHLDEVDGRIEG